jgi:hypothetical protein
MLAGRPGDETSSDGPFVDLTATASGGTIPITSVELLSGTTSIGTSQQSPFAVSWSNAMPGPYTLTAKAVDNTGAAATSAPVSITVSVTGQGGGTGIQVRCLSCCCWRSQWVFGEGVRSTLRVSVSPRSEERPAQR